METKEVTDTTDSPKKHKVDWSCLTANKVVALMFIVLFVWISCLTCTQYPRTRDLSFDYLGVIVSAFSIIVMLLIGWQIFSFMSHKNDVVKNLKDFEDKIKEMSDKVKDISVNIDNIDNLVKTAENDKRQLLSRIEDTSTLGTAESHVFLALSFAPSRNYVDAIGSLFCGLACFNEVKDKSLKIYKDKMMLAKQVIHQMPTNINIDERRLKEYGVVAYRSADKDIIEYFMKLDDYNKAKSVK